MLSCVLVCSDVIMPLADSDGAIDGYKMWTKVVRKREKLLFAEGEDAIFAETMKFRRRLVVTSSVFGGPELSLFHVGGQYSPSCVFLSSRRNQQYL